MTHDRTLPAHANCHHRHYALTCQDYEEMLVTTGQKCEMCGRHARRNTNQRLFIDHDHELGLWAVRGLLCHWCNSALANKPGWGVTIPPAATRYLSNPWYGRRLAELGVGIEPPPEPVAGARVLDAYGRTWTSTCRGWSCKGRERTWNELTERFGPIGLTVLLEDTP